MNTTLIIDSSKYMYHAAYGCWNNDKKFLTKMSDKKRFIKKYMKEVSNVIKLNPFAKRVVIATDSRRSWRHEIPSDFEYKGNRKKKKENKFDFGLLNEVMRGVEEIMVEKGVCVFSVPGAEGDDIMSIVSQALFDRGESSVLITNDGDMKQCVKHHEKGHFVATYSPDKKTYYVSSLQEDKPKVDPFEALFEGLSVHDPLPSMEPKELVNPVLVLFEKLVAGDPKDNVPSIYYRPYGKGKARITEDKANVLWSKYDIAGHISTVDEFLKEMMVKDGIMRNLIQSIKLMFPRKSGEDDVNTIAKNVVRNLRFLCLHKSVYCNMEISKDMHSKIIEKMGEETFGAGIKSLILNPLDIFDGTKYDFGDYKDSVYYKNA